MTWLRVFAVSSLLSVGTATTFFEEHFDDGDGWKARWALSEANKEQLGTWTVGLGDWWGDKVKGLGLKTNVDHRSHQITAKLASPPLFANSQHGLVLQYSVQHSQSIECGGGYIKLLSKAIEPKKMSKDAKFHISFGPDICGTSTRHIVAQLRFGEHVAKLNRLVTWRVEGGGTKVEGVRCATDGLTHFYTLHLRPDDTYSIMIDGDTKVEGSVKDDFSFEPTARNPGVASVSRLGFGDVGFVGFDLWQVRAGTVFDDILLTDDPELARQQREALTNEREVEDAMFRSIFKAREEAAAAERKQIEDTRKAQDEEIARMRLEQEQINAKIHQKGAVGGKSEL